MSDLFSLYKKVQNNNKEAIELLIKEHKKKFPKHYLHNISRNEWINAKEEYHNMYLHLTKSS